MGHLIGGMLLRTTIIFILLTISRGVEQIHISLGDNDSEMIVLWATASNVTSWVSYGTEHGRLNMTQRSEVSSLDQDSYRALGYVHRAKLKNLQHSTRYFYQVHAEGGPTSTEYNFTTLPVSQSQSTSFLMYGDLGVKDGSDTYPRLQAELSQTNYTAIWHVGDFAYDLPSDGGWIGDEFLRSIEPVAATLPYMVSPGNHEIFGDFLHYRTRFSTPGAAWPIPKGKMWYSYDIGLVHFISYSTEVYFTFHEEYECAQYYWLLDDLIRANENRARVPWIVAMGHRPMYCSNSDGDDCTGWIFGGRVRSGLENLFHTQGVDLIVEAHEHSYERLWPVYNCDVIQTNYMNPRGSVHVISGAAGNQEGNDKFTGHAKPWSAYRHSRRRDNNFGRLHVVNRTHIQWQQVRVKNGHVFDSFWLVQHTHGPFVPHVNCSLSTFGSRQQHSSCKCPPPFYLLILTYAIIFMACFAVVVVVVKLCWKWRRTIIGSCVNSTGPQKRLMYKVLFNESDEETDMLANA